MDDLKLEVESEAHKLGDKLQEQVVKGGHATVYFGEKYVYKITERKVMDKSNRIHSILSSSDDGILTKYVPKSIAQIDLGDHCLVVEELKEGYHPDRINADLLLKVNDLLCIVHKIKIDQVITNFEGDEISATKYWEHQLEEAKRFVIKLNNSGLLETADSSLIEEALSVIEEVSLKKDKPPVLVLVYKDVHRLNILVDDSGELSAIVDWDSSMSGPIELEYAVLWHRFPEYFHMIKPEGMDKDTFVVAGLVQGLRFWKSFTKDSKYVNEQRQAIRRTLDLYKKNR